MNTKASCCLSIEPVGRPITAWYLPPPPHPHPSAASDSKGQSAEMWQKRTMPLNYPGIFCLSERSFPKERMYFPFSHQSTVHLVHCRSWMTVIIPGILDGKAWRELWRDKKQGFGFASLSWSGSSFSFNTDPDPAFHFNADLPGLHFELPLQASILSLHSRPPFWASKNFWNLTLMRIRIQLFTVMRLWIQLP